jgi:cell division septum initiation protein DivIVA
VDDASEWIHRELAEIEELEKRLADLKARLPAHSISPSMMMDFDDLEGQLSILYARREKEEQA